VFAGAVTTIITLLRKPDTRCAAITMLGKTVELCVQQVLYIRTLTSIAALRIKLFA
jgi:hypothetical protein